MTRPRSQRWSAGTGRWSWACADGSSATPHDAEDAFQAAFLVLDRRAATVRPQAVAGWLHGVAIRTAREARRRTVRRRFRETQVRDFPEPWRLDVDSHRELRSLLDEEVARLPERYREPVVLCDLEGQTRREAARRLGVPHGTLSNRLTAARRMLARRLSRRGALSAGALAVVAVGDADSSMLTAATLHAALPAHAPTAVTLIAEGALNAMYYSKIKLTVIALAVVASLGLGVGAYSAGQEAGKATETPRPTSTQSPAKAAEPPPATAGNPAREKVIEERLEQRVSVRFKNKPLLDALDELQELSKLNIVVDHPAFEEAGLTITRKVTLRVEDVPLKTALKLLLAEVEMTYIVRDGLVWATNAKGARGRLVQRVILVEDLIGPDSGPETLVKIIHNTIEPKSWSDMGGPATIEYFPLGKSLVVNQYADTHEQLQSLLDALRLYKKAGTAKRTGAGN
ncbi:MAG: RNA polymerase sigma factor [Gemmataceae bacterium]